MTRIARVLVSCLLCLPPVVANEALDILEGRKDAAEVVLPREAGEEESAEKVRAVALEETWEPGQLDPLWARAVLFQDESNPWLQELAVQGLFHWQGAWGNAEHDLPATNWRSETEIESTRARRSRLGARLRMFHNTEIEAVADYNSSRDDFGVHELKAKVEILPELRVSVGKMKPRFSAEYSMDEQLLLTPERSLLSNQFAPARTLGIMIDGERNRWDYGLGWFSGDNDDDLPTIKGDGFLLAKLGYTSIEKGEEGVPLRTRWHLDYLHNFDGSRSRGVPRYAIPPGTLSMNGSQPVAQPWFRHLFSTGIEVDHGRFSFLGDFMIGRGSTNAWGLTLMPSWWAIPGTLRVVGRYHYADSDDAGALITGLGTGADPFFDTTPLYVGDEYHSFYLGANLHLYQDKLVILNGFEYAILNDDAGAGADADFWMWHSAARFSF